MSKVAKVLGIGGDNGAVKKAEAAQRQQEQLLSSERKKNEALLAGQKRLSEGAGGFLSFLDDDLKSTFGG